MPKPIARLIDLSRSPVAFMGRYVARHALSHTVVLGSVILAVGCSIGSQYAVKHLVDTLTAGAHPAVWQAFFILAGLICADNMLWRLGGWTATHCFVAVTGDLRRDLFQHLTGHSPSYFADRPPGTLAGRITATGNAIYTVENTFAWNVLPPLLAVLGSIGVLLTVSPAMAGVLVLISAALAWMLGALAARGRPLHHQYAADAAAVDGELVDVINNMPLVARLRRHPARAQALRRAGGARDDHTQPQPALSGKAAIVPRRDHGRADRRVAGLVDPAVGAGGGQFGRRGAGHLAGLHHPARHARPSGGIGRHHAARRPPRRGAGHAAAAARADRCRRGAASGGGPRAPSSSAA